MVRLFRVSLPGNALALIAADAALILFCYIAPLYFTTDVAPRVYLLDDGGLWRTLLVGLVILLGLYFHDLYEIHRIRSRIRLAQDICMTLGLAFVLQALMSYGSWNLPLPKWTMLSGSLLLLILLAAWRVAYSAAISETGASERVLFLGATPAAAEMMVHLAEHPELGLKVVGYLSDNPFDDRADHPGGDPDPGMAGPDGPSRAGTSRAGLAPQITAVQDSVQTETWAGREWAGNHCLGSLADLDAAIVEHHPARLIVAMSERRSRLPLNRLLELRADGIRIEEMAQAYEYVLLRVSTRDLRLSDLIFSTSFGPQPHQMVIQGLYSWTFSLLLAVVTLPVMLITAVLVKLTSPGPVLLRQVRTGLNGAPFKLYKFRSMYQDAEMHTGAVWSKKGDPRITPLGRWLRRLRIDELPQVFNVLRGEMSLVGPRPERPEFVHLLQTQIPYYLQRHCVKPGITGWAQINHKYTDSVEDAVVKLEYDLYYIKNMATSLDLYILFHTFKTMLLGRGAQ
jgi:lipopolysaccharide/colanic/teichoic acid biosynthesis glycosyltransferase